jgi:hypothetical protein
MLCIQNPFNPPIEFFNLIATKHFGIRHSFTNVLAKDSVALAEILIAVAKGFILKPAHCTNQFTLHSVGLTLWRHQLLPKALKFSSPIPIRHAPAPLALLQIIAPKTRCGWIVADPEKTNQVNDCLAKINADCVNLNGTTPVLSLFLREG